MKYLIACLLFISLSFNGFSQTRHLVEMLDRSYNPKDIVINVGDTIEWVNKGIMVHTATSGISCEENGKWDSGDVRPGDSWWYVFTSEETFDYFCKPHCRRQTGTVKVVAAE